MENDFSQQILSDVRRNACFDPNAGLQVFGEYMPVALGELGMDVNKMREFIEWMDVKMNPYEYLMKSLGGDCEKTGVEFLEIYLAGKFFSKNCF